MPAKIMAVKLEEAFRPPVALKAGPQRAMKSLRDQCRSAGPATAGHDSKEEGVHVGLSKPECISKPFSWRPRPKISGIRSQVRRVPGFPKETSPAGVIFSRTESIAEVIEARIQAASISIDAALYRFGNPRLSRALCEAQRRGVAIRLIVDHGKFEYSEDTRNLLTRSPFPFRLAQGRDGARSKMHHKFVIVDGRTVLTGSYNWTLASEEQNYENLLVLQDSSLVDLHRQEFDSLWASVTEAQDSGSPG